VGKVVASIKVLGLCAVSCAKASELIEKPLGICTRLGLRNHVLDETMLKAIKAGPGHVLQLIYSK